MLTLLKVKKTTETAIPPKHFKHVANKNQHSEPPPPSQSHQCRARLPGGAPAWSRPCWGPSVGDTLIEVPLGGFLLPLQRVSQEKWHIISQSLARQGRQKEQEVKNSPARTIRKYTVAPRTPWGGVVGSVWKLFSPHCIFRLLVIFSLCCRSDLRLLSSFGLFGMQTPPAPPPTTNTATLELVRPKGSGNQSGKT